MNTKLILAWGIVVTILSSLLVAMVLVEGFAIAVFATLGAIVATFVIVWAIITIVDS